MASVSVEQGMSTRLLMSVCDFSWVGDSHAVSAEPSRPKRMRRPTSRLDEASLSLSGEELLSLRLALEISRKQSSMASTHIPEAPIFRPTVEEWADPCRYLAKIRLEAEEFGICKIIPPVGWTPPCTISSREQSRALYKTRLQQIHRLQEGLPFDDGDEFTFTEYRKMAQEFKQSRYANVDGIIVLSLPRYTAFMVSDAAISHSMTK
jgi:hypothetical protein